MVLLGKRIKELRTKYGLTQTDLAIQVGVSTATITAYECDSRQPSYDVLIKLARALKVSTDSLLLNRSESIIDVSELSFEQVNKVQNFVDYLKISDLIEFLYSKEPIDNKTIERLEKKYSDVFTIERYEIIRKIMNMNNNRID